jgi:hypothetical protein
VVEWGYSSKHSLLSALDGGEWSASRSDRFITGVRGHDTVRIVLDGIFYIKKALLFLVFCRSCQTRHFAGRVRKMYIVTQDSKQINVRIVAKRHGIIFYETTVKDIQNMLLISILQSCKLDTDNCTMHIEIIFNFSIRVSAVLRTVRSETVPMADILVRLWLSKFSAKRERERDRYTGADNVVF